MKWTVLWTAFCALFFAIVSEAQTELASKGDSLGEEKIIFNPLVSSTARTVEPFHFSLQRGAGANINTSFIISSLTVGIFPRLELGTSPIFYASKEHKLNYNGKLNFWKGDHFDWAFAFSELRFHAEVVSSSGRVERPDVVMNTGQIILNYHPDWTAWSFSTFYANSCGYIDSSNAMVYIYSISCREEGGLDIQIPIADRQWITFGGGTLRDAGISPYEDTRQGFGSAWSILRPGKFLSRPSLGVYYSPTNGKVLALITTTFFEDSK